MRKYLIHPFMIAVVCIYAMVFACLPVLVTPAYAERLPPPKVDLRPVIRVVTENFPPFQYELHGKIVGPMYEHMLMSCEISGLNCIIEMLPWKEALRDAETGKADAIFSILLGVKEREEMFFTSPPIVTTAYSFFVASDSKWRWQGEPHDLDGMTIGTYGPSGTSIVAAEIVGQSETARLVIERTNLTAFSNLVAGAYGPKSAIVVNRDVGKYLLDAHNLVGPRIAGTLKEVYFGVGYSRKSRRPELRLRLMSAFAVVKRRNAMGSAYAVPHPDQRK